MWSSSPGTTIDKNNNKFSTISPSKSSSSTCSSPSPNFFPLSPIQNQSMAGGNSMEEVWDDINLASLHDHPNPNTSNRSTNHHAFHGMIFQDFLATPSSNKLDTVPTRDTASLEQYSSCGVNNFSKNSSGQAPAATLLSLNSGCHHFQYQLESNSRVPAVRPNPQMHSRGSTGGTISFESSLDSPFDALMGSSALFPSICQKRPQENADVSVSGDRRHKRMIKNRESAARSRARKQESFSPLEAYTTELEREVSKLSEENSKLRRQQERFLAAARAQLPKKHTLYRTSTAPF